MTEAICKKCSHYDKCIRQYYTNCPTYDPQDTEQTNEQWFCTLSTEEKATFLASNKMLNFDYQMWVEWLKEKHDESV